MAETKNKIEKAPAKQVRKKIQKKVIVGVDSTEADVLKLISEGHKLFFEEGDDFLELSEETIKQLDMATKQRYRMAKNITEGVDVMGPAIDSARGYSVDYKVRAGSANENTMVYGKEAGMEYTWGRTDKHNKKLSEGWVIDDNPNVKTRFNESGTRKTLGGQNAPEANLYRRKKETGDALRAKRKEIRNARLLKTQNTAKDAAIKLGVRVTD